MRSDLRALTVFCLVAAALVGSGCHRAARPEAGGARTVEAGVPESFGSEAPDAPVVTWDFGDGSPPQQGARVSHAFPRAGTYTVRALEKDKKDEVLASAQVTVVSRPVLRAIPAEAEVAVYFPQLRGNVDPLMDFYSRLMGETQALESLEDTPLLSLVLRDLRGEPRVVDPEEGVGFFSLPDFQGTVALLGVTDVEAAMDAVVGDLESGGIAVSHREPGGAVRFQRPNGDPLLLFADRGYVYLAVPDTEDEEEGALSASRADGMGLEAARASITGMRGPGLSELPLLGELQRKVGSGNVHFFVRPVEEDASSGLRGVFAALKVEEARAELEGWVALEKALFEGKSAPGSELLGKAPAGPFAALMISIPPEELAKLVFGAPGSERRERTLLRLREEGFDAANADSLLSALRGDLTLLAYFDAPAFYRNLLRGSQRPEPRGTLLFEAGLVRSEQMVEWLTGRLKARGQPYEVVKEAGATRLRTRAMEQPVEFTITANRLSMTAGEAIQGRAVGDMGSALKERFGNNAFEPGHLSAMVDVGRLRAELDAPQEVPGVPAQQLPAVRSLVGTLLDQLPPVELVFVDFMPEEGGGRFRARTVLRSR
ncbi:PKD domain-containing protein [Archangium lipolyticum]|uniref:PKD domain-containing protein n=1 Tax=Archangium lipolyticum TaxID=2970465 RepID=UPI00214A7231|nr:PKD domain-containing protein [Archangium lipolyticum]